MTCLSRSQTSSCEVKSVADYCCAPKKQAECNLSLAAPLQGWSNLSTVSSKAQHKFEEQVTWNGATTATPPVPMATLLAPTNLSQPYKEPVLIEC